MSMSLKVDGLKDIERALLDLPKGTAKGVVRRVLKAKLKPVAEDAARQWPGQTKKPFVVGGKVKRSQRGDSLARDGRSVVNVFVGAHSGHAPHAHLIEFGTGPRFHQSGKFVGEVAPTPLLQPAWDRHRKEILRGLAQSMWEEIAKTQARRARRTAKRAR